MKINILDFYIRRANPARKLILDDNVPLERFPCPVCETEDQSIEYSAVKGKEGGKYLERKYCVNCSHVFISYGPSRRWHENYYNRDWFKGKTHGSLNWLQLLSLEKRRIREMFSPDRPQFTDFDWNFFVAEPLLRRGMKIMEIGAGNGRSLLPFRKRGLECFAIEPSVNSAQACRGRGIHVLNLTFQEALELKPQDFPLMDVILSNHSLEHFTDPNLLLKCARKFLRPEGLLIINVPNKEYVDVFPETFFVLHPQNFSEISLRLLLSKHGFRVLRKMVNENLLFVARQDSSLSPSVTTNGQLDKEGIKDFYRGLWARRYALAQHQNSPKVIEWDSGYLMKNLQPVIQEEASFYSRKGHRTFLVEMEDVKTDYVVFFESHIDDGAAFGVIK